MFRVAEKRLEAVIAERFALPEAADRIKPLDRALLAGHGAAHLQRGQLELA